MNIADWKALPEAVQKLFRKYRILSLQEIGNKTVEGYTTCNLRKARDSEGKLLGDGPLLAPDCIQRFVNACLVDGKVEIEWLDWIFFQVGGGQEAQRRANQAMEQVKERFLDERMRGFRDTKGQYRPPLSREEAEAKWKGSDPRFQEVLYVADQDMTEKLQVFGFSRHWPGPNKKYEMATNAVRTFLNLQPNIAEMNYFMRRTEQKDKTIQTGVKHYTTIESLEQAIKKVERFFNSRAAREDVRIDLIHDSEFLSVFCPLTYSAAVKYGWDAWPHANRQLFEQCLEGTNSWNDPWRKMVGNDEKVLVYFQFKVPVPSWVGYEQNKFTRITLQNICAVIQRNMLKRLVTTGVEWYDEENRKVTLDAIIERFHEEPTRSCDPDSEEYPILRGPRVYETAEQAQVVSTALMDGWRKVVAWGLDFSPKQIVVDYMPK